MAVVWLQDTCQRRCIRQFLEATPSEEPQLSRLAASTLRERERNAGDAPGTREAPAPSSSSDDHSGPGVSNPDDPSLPDPHSTTKQHKTDELSGRNGMPSSDENGGEEADVWRLFRVAKPTLNKSCHCIDIVTEDMHDANCFTKAYSRYVKGTGSVLATQNLHLLDSFPDWAHREEV